MNKFAVDLLVKGSRILICHANHVPHVKEKFYFKPSQFRRTLRVYPRVYLGPVRGETRAAVPVVSSAELSVHPTCREQLNGQGGGAL